MKKPSMVVTTISRTACRLEMWSTLRFRVSRMEPITRKSMMPQLTTTDSGTCKPPRETISTFSSSFRAAVNAFIALPPF